MGQEADLTPRVTGRIGRLALLALCSLPGSGQIVVQALIDGSSELHVTRSGLYWKHLTYSKPGRNGGKREPTRVNGRDWQPQWVNESGDGADRSEVFPIAVGTLDLQVKPDPRNRNPVSGRRAGDEFVVLFDDPQPGDVWYQVELAAAVTAGSSPTQVPVPRDSEDLERRASGITGRVTDSDGPTGAGLYGVRVLAGKLELRTGAQTDVLLADPLAGETVTDRNGNFRLEVPAGLHDVVFWKQGYVPKRERRISSPGNWQVTIGRDTSGRPAHQELRVERPQPGPPQTKRERLLSLKRPALLSSRVAGSAAAGNDGVKNGGWGFKTVDDPDGQWWQVNLQAPCIITEVRVFNSVNFQPYDAKYFEVWLSSDGLGWVRKYRHNGTHPGGADGKPARVQLFNAEAQWVRIRLPDAASLHLDEVEVFGWESTGKKQPEVAERAGEEAPESAAPGAAATAAAGGSLHGEWRGPWRNSLGQTGNGVWVVTAESADSAMGHWDRMPFTGQRSGGAVTFRIANQQSNCVDYDARVSVAGNVGRLDYTATNRCGGRSYTGTQELKRVYGGAQDAPPGSGSQGRNPEPPTPTLPGGGATVNPGSARSGIAGMWKLDAWGSLAKLEFTPEGGSWTGRADFGAVGWEPITKIAFNPSTGDVSFHRVRGSQDYAGRLTGDRMEGKFSGSAPWHATRGEGGVDERKAAAQTTGGGAGRLPAIVNPSFELGPQGAALTAGIYSHSAGAPPYGWEIPAGDIEVVRAGYAGWWAAQDGAYSVDLNGMSQGSLRQRIGGFTPGASYTLVFALSSNRAWCAAPGSCPVRVSIGGASRTFPAGGPQMTFQDVSLPFTAPAAVVELRFDSTVASQGGAVIDHVRIVPR
jgi:hypothetical protein